MKTQHFHIPQDAEIGEDIDLDAEDVRMADGARLTESGAEDLTEEILHKAGRPSLTAPGMHSPQITFRVPEGVKRFFADTAKAQGRRQSDVLRDALDEYIDRHS